MRERGGCETFRHFELWGVMGGCEESGRGYEGTEGVLGGVRL